MATSTSGIAATLDMDARPLAGGMKALLAAALALGPAWDVIGRRWVDRNRERMARGVGPDGAAWLPSKRALREGGQTLLDTRQLEGSLTHQADDQGVTIGTDLVKAPALHFGATIVPKTAKFLRFFIPGRGWVFAKKVVLPPRPFVGVGEGDHEEFAEILANHLRRRLEEAKRGDPSGSGAPA